MEEKQNDTFSVLYMIPYGHPINAYPCGVDRLRPLRYNFTECAKELRREHRMKRNAFRAALPHTIPIAVGFLFLIISILIPS